MKHAHSHNLAQAQSNTRELYRLLSAGASEGNQFQLTLAQLMQAIGLTTMVHEALLTAASDRMSTPP